jgi:hypothetical protein
MHRRPTLALRPAYLVVVLTVCFALPVTADKGELKPVPAQGQHAVEMGKKHFVEETKNGIKVVAEGYATSEVFTANIGIENDTQSAIPVEQERFFAFNAYDRSLYRVPDYEVRVTLAWAADEPPPPPPPPRHYYTLRSDTYGHYSGDISLNDNGLGYVSINGFSHTYGEIQEHYDYSATLGYLVGATIRKAIERRKFRKAIEEVDKSYFRNGVIQPGQFANGVVIFSARSVNVSPRAPFKLIVFIGETNYQFVFQQ